MATTKKETAAKTEAKEVKEVKEVKEEKVMDVMDAPIDYNERVRIRLPRNSKKGDTLYVAVNNYSALIKRGEFVYVPLYVAMHIQECQDQEERAEILIERLSNDY